MRLLKLFVFGVCISCLFEAPAGAQSVSKKVTASNGVVIDVREDSFAQVFDYIAPEIRFEVESSPKTWIGTWAVLFKRRSGGELSLYNYQGQFGYSDSAWRTYDNAVYRGGASVSYTRTDSEVARCYNNLGNYGDVCTYVEKFGLVISDDELANYAENGTLQIQVRPQRGNPVLLSIPVSHFEAIADVSE